MTKETGGPAFPTERNLTQGMTLRDYFAAKAMVGMIHAFGYKNDDMNFVVPDAIPTFAYQMADNMLKAREQ